MNQVLTDSVSISSSSSNFDKEINSLKTSKNDGCESHCKNSKLSNLTCNECGKSCVRESKLQRHMDRVHNLKLKLFQCEKCRHRFSLHLDTVWNVNVV